jgi:DNA-directed RNA polymerase alpha subunit
MNFEDKVRTDAMRKEALSQAVKYVVGAELGVEVCVISMAENMYKFLKGQNDIDLDQLLDSHIDDALDITVRARNCLVAEKIYTVRDVISHSENDLIKFPNMGRKSVEEIKIAMGKVGLSLKER